MFLVYIKRLNKQMPKDGIETLWCQIYKRFENYTWNKILYSNIRNKILIQVIHYKEQEFMEKKLANNLKL